MMSGEAEKPAPIDLAFATDEELINELGKRFEGAIFASEKSSRDDEKSITYRRWFGSLTMCVGLAERMRQFLTIKGEEPNYGEGSDE